MSQAIVVKSYTFNPATKQITFSDYSNVDLEGVKLITNVNSGIIIYQFNDGTKGASVSGNTLTLDYDTSSMSASDALMIIYDPPTAGIFARIAWGLQSLIDLVRAPTWTVISNGSPKVQCVFTTDTAVGTVGTVNALASLTSLNTIDARELIWSAKIAEYNTGLRSKIQ